MVTLGMVTVGMGRAKPMLLSVGPSQHHNERKEGNQCSPEMKNNPSDLLDLKARIASQVLNYVRNREPRVFPLYPIAFPALSQFF